MQNKKLFLIQICFVMMGTSLLKAQTGQTVKDIDGNIYHTITIGTQVWMVENLKTTKYRNGDPIPNVADNTQWANLTTGAYCNYDNDINKANTYGHLYNWQAVSDSRNLAPAGWHLATDDDWTKLTDFSGGETIAGGRLKEIGTAHWNSPNNEATNESGFTALPGGVRSDLGGFAANLGILGQFWTSSEMKGLPQYAWYRFMGADNGEVTRGAGNKKMGFSVRCLKD